jgi:hypothetical protein
MRILHTEWSDGWGGQERRVVSEIAGMRSRGHEVWLANRPAARIAAEAERRGIPALRLPFRSAFDPATVYRLRDFIRRERIDVVNTHSGKDSWAGGMAARLAGVKLVRTRHLDLPLRRSPAEERFRYLYTTERGTAVRGTDPRRIPRIVVKDRDERWLAQRLWIYSRPWAARAYDALRA